MAKHVFKIEVEENQPYRAVEIHAPSNVEAWNQLDRMPQYAGRPTILWKAYDDDGRLTYHDPEED